jgi:hypothetical protein
MRKPHAKQYGSDIWGLGQVLYAPLDKGDFVAGHDGSNAPAINTTARVNPVTGDGIVILETGNTLLATQVAGEWVFWSTGFVDTFMVLLELRATLIQVAIGAGVAFLLVFLLVWRLTRRRTAPKA